MTTITEAELTEMVIDHHENPKQLTWCEFCWEEWPCRPIRFTTAYREQANRAPALYAEMFPGWTVAATNERQGAALEQASALVKEQAAEIERLRASGGRRDERS